MAEKSISIGATSKNVRLDLYVETDEGTIVDIEINTAEGKFTQDIAAEVERVKQHNETRVEYMTLMMELKQQRREGYAEGEATGLAKGLAQGQDSERLNSIRNLMESLHLTAQQAMDALKIPVKEQPKYAAQI